jgi:hypothetical protein
MSEVFNETKNEDYTQQGIRGKIVHIFTIMGQLKEENLIEDFHI